MKPNNRSQANLPSSLHRIKRGTDVFFDWIEFAALAAIAVTAVLCFARELWTMISSGKAEMGELLLLFMYTEIVVMAKAAMHSSHQVLIGMPISIAVVAMARYMVVGTSHDPMHQIMYAAAILILAMSLFLWGAREWLQKRQSRNAGQ